MKVAIMQPYFMPYIGYFQTMAAVDKYVVYDDVQYIKGGWVSHNYLLIGGRKQMFTIRLKGASPNKLFNEIEIGDNFRKLTQTLHLNYHKAPYYDEVMPVLSEIFSYEDRNLARFLWNSYRKLFEFLGIDTEIILSSSIDKDCTLKGKDKVIDICHSLGADTYINAIGGQELYNKKEFAANGIELYFLRTDSISYPQFGNVFEPGLSFIDVLMFNGREGSSKLLSKYTLV